MRQVQWQEISQLILETRLHVFDYVTKAFVPFSIKQMNNLLKMKMCTIE